MTTTNHALLVERRHALHAHAMRRVWGLAGTGPRLDVETNDGANVSMRLRGRSLTLAQRLYQWTWHGSSPFAWRGSGRPSNNPKWATAAGAMGTGPEEEGPLDEMLREVAAAQAMRSAAARAMGLGMSAMPLGALTVDRAMAIETISSVGQDAFETMIAQTRSLDAGETIPFGQKPRFGKTAGVKFGIMPCREDTDTKTARRPELRLQAFEISATANYANSTVTITGVTLPQTVAMAATGRRLGNLIETGRPHLNRRLVTKAETNEGYTLIRLQPDMVEVRALGIQAETDVERQGSQNQRTLAGEKRRC